MGCSQSSPAVEAGAESSSGGAPPGRVPGLIDVSKLTKMSKSDDGLLPQPKDAKYRLALIEIFDTSKDTGGSDKLTNGHRFDTIPLANGLIKAGMSCQIFNYCPPEHDMFMEVARKFDGLVVRCNPGQIDAAGGSQNKFDKDMQELAKSIPVWPTADVMTRMGAKDALCHIRNMDFGLEDTLGYYSPADMERGFKKVIAFQPRVVKQNRGSSGEGIWIIKQKSENYCKTFGERLADDSEMLILKEANDNHIEEHTVGEFIEFCVNGRTDKSGTWTSKGTGKYFEGGAEAGGQMVDQRFIDTIDTLGEARFFMLGMDLYNIEHYMYPNGVGGATDTTVYAPDAEKYAKTRKKLETETPEYMKALSLDMGQLPLLWAADFLCMPENKKSEHVIGEFNCSCLGITGFLDARGKDLSVCKPADIERGQKMCDQIGLVARRALNKKHPSVDVSSLTKKSKNDNGLIPQPEVPEYKLALVEIFDSSKETGGSDKLTNGHRFDTIPLANGLIKAGMCCQIINYVPAEHDKFMQVVRKFDGIVVRCNPGQIDAAGGSQNKFDEDMQKLAKLIPVWPTADVMTKMGAKDALCQIKDMDFGLVDTLGYYSPEDMVAGFKKTIAFQPRVVKQNRGSAGEGIWIIKLKTEKYCKTFGERVADDSEMLILKEANDNHTEEHTVGEFIEFCVNGRTAKSGTWTSKGTGEYYKGGKEAHGQMVDQRFIPTIDSLGEARFFMLGQDLYNIEHYMYPNGVGGATDTTVYAPDAEKYAQTKKKLETETPAYMQALGLDMSQLPLLWAADFLTLPGNEKSEMVIGEFNCSCLGVTGFLDARGKDDFSVCKKEDTERGQKMCDQIGAVARKALDARFK